LVQINALNKFRCVGAVDGRRQGQSRVHVQTLYIVNIQQATGKGFGLFQNKLFVAGNRIWIGILSYPFCLSCYKKSKVFNKFALCNVVKKRSMEQKK
jgi:hypothetical protein